MNLGDQILGFLFHILSPSAEDKIHVNIFFVDWMPNNVLWLLNIDGHQLHKDQWIIPPKLLLLNGLHMMIYNMFILNQLYICVNLCGINHHNHNCKRTYVCMLVWKKPKMLHGFLCFKWQIPFLRIDVTILWKMWLNLNTHTFFFWLTNNIDIWQYFNFIWIFIK
jgi:hypothetical protein